MNSEKRQEAFECVVDLLDAMRANCNRVKNMVVSREGLLSLDYSPQFQIVFNTILEAGRNLTVAVEAVKQIATREPIKRETFTELPYPVPAEAVCDLGDTFTISDDGEADIPVPDAVIQYPPLADIGSSD